MLSKKLDGYDLNLTTMLSVCTQTLHSNVRRSCSASNLAKCTSHIGTPHVGHGGWCSGLSESGIGCDCAMTLIPKRSLVASLVLARIGVCPVADKSGRAPSTRYGEVGCN
jgi:hypothetical protein